MIKAAGQHEPGDHPHQRDDAADSRGPRHRRQLAHVHLVHERHPADLRDSEGAGRAAAGGRGGAAAERRRVRARLRVIKSKAAQQLAEAKITRVVTVHDGYGYLLQEFGLEVAGVVQPAHGLTPSAAELRDMVKLLQREKIRVVFSEETFPEPMLKVLRDEAGVKVYIITHIASGAYTADKFEREMQRNVDTMIRALVTEA